MKASKYKPVVRIVGSVLLAASLLAGCATATEISPQLSSQQLTEAPTEDLQVAPQGGENEQPLATPYASSPAAGICAGPANEVVVSIEIFPDIPSPRCLKVTPEQRLEVINRTDEDIQIELGSQDASLAPGAAFTIEVRLGDILAPGVHQLEVSPYSGPEIVMGDM